MENLFLFGITAVLYLVIGCVLAKPKKLGDFLKVVGVVVLLALPINIDGHVLTIAGNAVGEKGVYSVMSFYQKAETGGTFTGISVMFGQDATDQAAAVFSILGSQKARRGDAVVILGITMVQIAERDAVTMFGVTAYQHAGRNVLNIASLAGYQEAGMSVANIIGITGYQKGDRTAETGIGLTGYQEAGQKVGTYAGIAGYQRVGDQERYFGAMAPLKAK